ncbi:MAG: tRNA-dihydrouridine synthase [Syntrophobacteraceae bacterium]
MPKPIFALAPISGATDSPFRQVCKDFGVDVVYSELASATALIHNPRLTLEMLRFDKVEHPYVVQLFGSVPAHFAIASKLVTEVIQPDGIDINFGCPVPKVTKSGAGAALMANLPLARDVICSVIDHTHLPVSIKVRTKAKDVELETFLAHIGDLDIKALMIHGRTLAQRFSGPNEFIRTRTARRYFKGVVLANGGAMNPEKGIELLEQTAADGIGVARGALGRPWIFRDLKDLLNGGGAKSVPVEEIIGTAIKHARLAYSLKGHRGLLQMRKHLCWYIQNVPNAGRIRQSLATVNSVEDVEKILGSI